VIRAVRAVLDEDPFRERFTFEVFGWESPQGKRAQSAYPFGAERHGFVLLSPDGALLTCLPGHDYGAEEIEDALRKAL
jgi:hypothetical protein